MPAGEDYFYRPVVTVAGAVLAEQAAARLIEVYVDDSVHLPGLLVLRFSDPEDTVLDLARLKIGTPVSLAVGSSSPGTPEPLIEATVTSLEREIDSRGATTLVRALDARRTLQGGARVATFVDQSVSDVVASVARTAGLSCAVDRIDPVYPQLTQDGVSDWEFLTHLAASHGAVLSMRGTTLQLRTPPDAASAPSGRGNPLVIDAADQVLSLRATITDSGQVPTVQARGWDPKSKKEVVHAAKARTTSAALTTTPAALASSRGTQVLSAPGAADLKQVEAMAAAEAGGRSGAFAELEARLRGNTHLLAGAAIRLVGAGSRFDGCYVLTAVRHSFDEVTGYVTDITVAHASDRSSYGVVAGGMTAAPGPQGLLPALVTNVKDPDKQGRVKVRFPTLSDSEESWWARVLQPGAGPGRGTVLLPEVGDEVLVAFTGTGVACPYVLGGVYNGKDLPDPPMADHVNGNGQVVRRGFTSRTGMSVEVLEDESSTKLNIRSKDSKERITISQKPTGIEITSEGDITIAAKQRLKLDAQEVQIAAKQDLTLSGMNVKINAQANIQGEAQAHALLKAGANAVVEANMQAAVKGNAGAELSATGPVTVRGALVNIN